MNYREASIKILSSLLTVFIIYSVYSATCLFFNIELVNNYFWIGAVMGSIASDIYYLKKEV
jgi:hypothetical protein